MKFSKKELAGSLCCPALSFLWGLVRFLNAIGSGLEFTGIGLFRWSFIGAMLIGGVLCAVLTAAFDIHTEYYLEKRPILIAAVFVFQVIIARFSVSGNIFYIVLYLLVGVAAYAVLFAKIRDVNTDPGELAVLVLSDPILYWTVSLTLQYVLLLE